MIKINLLGRAEPKSKARATRAVAPMSKALQMGALLGSLAASLAVVGLAYLVWSSSVDSLTVELKKQQAEQARLAGVRQQNARFEHESALLEERIRAIQMLRSGRVGPTEFMNALADVVNKGPHDLYLSSVAAQGNRMVFHGQAGSANAVATLLTAMKTSGYFTDVQLRQLYEDDVESVLNYKFSMDCLIKSALAGVAPTPAGPAAKTPASPSRPVL